MKLFPFRPLAALTVLSLLSAACATTQVQYGKKNYKVNSDTLAKSPLVHTFYLIGDAGDADKKEAGANLDRLGKRLEKASSKSTLLFLGDNLYPAGMPAKGSEGRKDAEFKITRQMELTRHFKGKTIFIPGNHDWYSEGAEGLKREEQFVTERLGNQSFLPQDGCALSAVAMSDHTALIVIDSQWYLKNWDGSPEINDDCDIKTREDFFRALEDKINENQTRLTVLAVHHPLMSNGAHGGQYAAYKYLFPFDSDVPLPGIGALASLVRKTSGASPQDLQNKKYNEFIKRIKTLIQDKKNVVVVSGHDHNLQYLEKDDVKQVISGSGSKSEAARAINQEDFSYGGSGYATLQVYEKGESVVTYYGHDGKEEKVLYRHLITPAKQEVKAKEYGNKFPAFTQVAVYDSTFTKKGAVYNFLWGKHYRDEYLKPIKARNVSLDTLYGGLKPIESGGGHQSRSLRLESKSGKQYTMRALQKSATKFLQAVAFKNQYVEKDFRGTYAEDFLMDFYTSSHPYTSFAVDKLAADTWISHTNPQLFYVPKQAALGNFNLEYGDELYLIEERPDDGFEKLRSFGKPDAIIGTNEVLEHIQKDEKYLVDERAYIRARLFDMLIGDWDRHYDQWRWGEYEQDGKVLYKPIPRDRDEAFPKYGGALMTLLLKMPVLRHIKSYKKDIGNVKWFNADAYPLDLALIVKANAEDWLAEAQSIQRGLTDAEIDAAFKDLPAEVQDATLDEIKANLKSRKKRLDQYAAEYFKVLQKTVLLVGTNKKDKFVINRLAGGKTQVGVYRVKNEGDELRYTKTYTKKATREIWIYGLDDEDVYEVKGNGKSCIRVRLLGGLDQDRYAVENGKNINIYDFKNKENDYQTDTKTAKVLTNSYEINRYDYRKPKYNALAGLPNFGYNPDDGIKVGIAPNYTVNGFKRNPYSQRHSLRANYYFATKGYEFIYKGIFPNILRNWQFQIDARYTGPVFSFNFFGYGNETANLEDNKGMDYNRVKTQQIFAAPSFVYKGDSGGTVSLQSTFESFDVANTLGRYVHVAPLRPEVFSRQQFAGANVRYYFENYDNPASPGMGMRFGLEAGWKFNLDQVRRDVPYAEALVGFSHKLSPDARWVLATQAKAKLLFSDDYEFYQMATIGGDDDVRAFRSERFSGKRSFFQSSDLRFEIGKIGKTLVPFKYGLLGGFDCGRVWLPGEVSDKWHTSYGGGVWLNGINVVTAKLSYFRSEEGGRISVGLGFGF